MLGWRSVATASASILKRAIWISSAYAPSDHLQGDEPVQPAVAGLVDDPHAPAAELPEDLIVGRPVFSPPLRRERSIKQGLARCAATPLGNSRPLRPTERTPSRTRSPRNRRSRKVSRANEGRSRQLPSLRETRHWRRNLERLPRAKIRRRCRRPFGVNPPTWWPCQPNTPGRCCRPFARNRHTCVAPSEDPGRVCATVAPSSGCPAPFAELSSWRNNSKTSPHFAHDRMCAPISESPITSVRSNCNLTSCSRLGQPVMAIPRIFDCVTASEQTFACCCLCYHAFKFKTRLSYELQLLSLGTAYPEYRLKREIVADLCIINEASGCIRLNKLNCASFVSFCKPQTAFPAI